MIRFCKVPCSGITDSSCNKNNNCTYPKCKTIEQVLKDFCSLDIRSGERIENKIFHDYIKKTREPSWVCLDCASERNAFPPKDHVYTVHLNICGICNENRFVTQPRDFGLDRYKIRVLYE